MGYFAASNKTKKRKEDGSNQWQDGYPNPDVIQMDIEKDAGFVLTEGETIICYCAVLVNDEPEYEKNEGKWMTNDDFVVFHRIAISENHLGKDLARMISDILKILHEVIRYTAQKQTSILITSL